MTRVQLSKDSYLPTYSTAADHMSKQYLYFVHELLVIMKSLVIFSFLLFPFFSSVIAD